MNKKSFIVISLFTIIFLSALMLAANPTISLTPLSPTTICSTGNDTLLYSVNASNIPANTNVVIYQSTDSTFNPSIGQGDSIDYIPGNAIPRDTVNFGSCIKTLGIFIDACGVSGTEPKNEYMVLTSGNGIRVSNLAIKFDNANSNSGNNNDNSINTGTNPCGYKVPTPSLVTNLQSGSCNTGNVFSAGPTDSIPANAIIVVFTSDSVNNNYNISGLCNLGYPIYIVQSACVRTIGAFTNAASCSATATTRYRKTIAIDKRQNCQDNFIYDRCGLFNLDGTYAIRQQGTDTASVANNGIRRNQIDSCGGIDYSQLHFNSDTTLKYIIPNTFCNTGMHYIKAILNPQTQPASISNTISFQYICNDVTATSNTTNICSGENAIINISSTNPNATFSWTVSGGTNITGAIAGTGNQINQTLTYSGTTNSNITYNITSNDNGCTKTTNVNVIVRNCVNIIDTVTICKGDSVQICGPEGYDNYSWTPNTGLSNSSSRCVFANPASTTIYKVNAFNNLTTIDSVELIKNGSFEDSMSFWNTDLFLLTPSCGGCNGWFYIGNTTYYCNSPDHTLFGVKLFNSSPTADTSKRVLYQTLNVSKNTNYKFSAWGYAHNSNNAIFNVKINNDVVVDNYALSAVGCVGWENFTGTWFSGNNTTATIIIKDYRDQIVGNDFSLDDISLRKIIDTSFVSDSIVVLVKDCDTCNLSVNIGGNLTICNGNSTTLSVPQQYDSVRWNTGATSNSISVNQAGTYSIIAYQNGCSATASAIVTQQNVNISIIGDTSICNGTSSTLSAVGQYDSIRWNTGATTASISVNQVGVYSVTAYLNGCSNTASANVSANSIYVSIAGNTSICNNSSTTLSVVGQFDSVRWSTNETTTSISTNQIGSYTVTAYKNGCSGTTTTNISETILTPTITGGNTVCGGTSVTLSTQTTYDSVRWNTNATTTSINVTQMGEYNVQVYKDGCSASASFIVYQISLNYRLNKYIDTICSGDTAKFIVLGGDVFDVPYDTVYFTQPGRYLVSYNTAMCGIFEDSVIVEQRSSITQPTIIGNLSICANQSTTLQVATGYDSYLWSPNGETTNSISVNQAGNYSVTVQTGNCSATASATVSTTPNLQPFNLGSDTSLCGNFSMILSTGNTNTIWSTGDTASQITITTAGQYIATISNTCNTISDTIVITKKASPVVKLGNDTAFCNGEIVLEVANSSDIRNIKWNTGETTSSITITAIGTYSVVVTNTNGCSDSDAINITSDCANEIWIPNAFTPDGNGVNDVFYVRGNQQNTVIEKFIIYNRWGNKVFEATNFLPNDITKGWNGTYKDKIEQLEVYGYEVIAKFANGEKRTLKGNVTLLK